jgi:circadian locomoter output cycle kaput protein
MAINPAPIAGALIPHQHSHQQRSTTTTQIIGTPFIDQSQYITAIPVQPVLTAPTSFPATVISPILPPPDYVHSNVVLTPAQNQIQDHLQRKHEELQKLIVQQQDELRRVSEQLFMARYGLLPSIVNVSLPFVAPMDSSSDNTGENNRYISSSAHVSQQSYHEHHHHQGPAIQNQSSTHVHIQSISQNPQNNQQPSQIMHHSNMMHQHQMPTYDMASQKSGSSHMDQSMESEQTNNDIMQYMQHQNINQSNQSANIHQMTQQPQQQQQQQQQPQQQQIMTNDDFELIPFQMMNTQAQILFSSGANNANNK